MHLEVQLVLAPYRGNNKPPAEPVVMIVSLEQGPTAKPEEQITTGYAGEV